ncbi:carbohydrate ABC transporter permease [Sediminispirochaeta smaragdinae]|uniref:Binding-protein-dependent transport systems inner membrane component n=1 Tax=Sediminispirochaeta smaragdinae (strain DSM 11293 / JCM 15392 / SEBR 4228) TaxID=573413 RepID=E1R4S6_SEDSS|nr:carbohydrate ABC transporter permease [Sediminispirochaeta smaragdinae]ADK82164.1 binding-protein-dependent transport systems inner membrane component [Sediminispirochaeta smaragdinae DSM 11293]
MRSRTSVVVKYFLAILCALLFLFPLYVLLNTSLKPFSEVRISEMWIPAQHISSEGFVESFSKLRGNLFNSFLLVIPVSFFSILFGSLNGYVFSKWKFRFSNLIFALIIFGMFIPYQSILIPLVQSLNKMGLYGHLKGLIITHIIYGLPISTLMFRNYYAKLPDELLEAGMLDGLGIWGVFRRIIGPISAPATVVVLIWQFTSVWNDFLFAVVITQKPSIQPITVALQNLAGSQVIEWNVQMAGALIAAIPTLLVYIFLGKYFIRGLLAGSVKG